MPWILEFPKINLEPIIETLPRVVLPLAKKALPVAVFAYVTDKLTITTGYSADLPKNTNIIYNQYKAGDITPEGRVFTDHGAERTNERAFDAKKIDTIIDNNKKKRTKEIDKDTGEVTWRYQDARGNTVITDETSKRIVTVYSYPSSKNDTNYISKPVKK
jgi:hypothetical protein